MCRQSAPVYYQPSDRAGTYASSQTCHPWWPSCDICTYIVEVLVLHTPRPDKGWGLVDRLCRTSMTGETSHRTAVARHSLPQKAP